MFDGLANKHTIEWIPVQRGELMQVQHGALLKRKNRNPMSLSLFHEKAVYRTGQR